MNDRRYTYLAGEDILLFKRRYTAFQKKIYCALAGSWMAGFLLMLLTLTACVGEELQKPLLGEGEGYLTLQVGAISAEVTSDPLTKATLENLPDTTEFSITIKEANNTVVKQYEKLSQIENPLVLKAGVTYTVEASHGKNEALQDSPYFSGSEEVTIQANKNNQVTVNASLANAMIIPVVTDSLKNHYKNDWKLTASVGGTSFTLASATEGIDTLYAKAEKNVTFAFSGKNLAEKEVSSSWSRTFDAGYAYQLQCNPNLTTFEKIEVKATAEHTYDNDNGYLTGTNIKSFSADWNGADSAAIASWTVKVCNSDKQVIRTYTGPSLDNMTYEDTGWPYIPQRSTLSASVKLKAGDVISDLKGDFTSWQAPDFGVSVSAQTSYSVYKNQGAATANTKDGSSIFDIKSSVSISEEILSKYPELLSAVTYSEDVDNATTSAALNTSASLTNLSWACHQLTASVTFDETTKTTSKPYACDVTGLPYKPSNMIEADWKFASPNNKYKDGMIQLGGIAGSGECTATSKMTFHIPENIAIQVKTNVTIRDYDASIFGWKKTTFTLSVNGNEIISQKNSSNYGDGKNYDLSEGASFQPNSYSLKLNSSYTLAGPWVKVYTLHILYK